MSTHFRPRPPTAPSSPVRPSTARSTVRAVTPSPPDSLDRAFQFHHGSPGTHERSKSEGFPGVQNLVINSSSIVPGPGLQRGGIASGRSSPVKKRSRSRSPKKRPVSTPTGLSWYQELRLKDQSQEDVEKEQDDAREEEGEQEDVEQDDSSAYDVEYPDTPTPMPPLQKRSAYTPLSTPAPFFNREQKDTTDAIATTPSTPPHQPHNTVVPHFLTPTTPPPPHHHPLPRKPTQPTDPTRHISLSLSAQSNISGGTANSQRSVFSTPGRDELERKKALVERDEGPFARAVSMQDLAESRRRVSEGVVEMKEGGGGGGGKGEEQSGEDKGKEKRRFCGMGGGRCVVM